MVLAHNHPSGDPMPSSQDARTTELLVEAGVYELTAAGWRALTPRLSTLANVRVGACSRANCMKLSAAGE